MDSVDARIFCEMPFHTSVYNVDSKRQVSAAGIGKKLGLDEKTVRTRIRNMERAGFIKYYQALPNLAFFNFRSVGSFRFEALNLATKHSVVEKISGIAQLVEGFDYMESQWEPPLRERPRKTWGTPPRSSPTGSNWRRRNSVKAP